MRIVEERAIKLTVGGSLGMALLGLVFAALTDSDAILLDGAYSLINFVVALASLYVVRLVQRPDDLSFPFGYSVFEPMLNLAKGLLIVVVVVLALASAVQALLAGGRPLAAGWALIYALIATAGCVLLALVTRRLAARTGSSIVAVDARNWTIDAVISGAVAVAFGIVLLLADTEYARWAVYADPVLVIVLCVSTLGIPLVIIRDNWRQIVGQAPDPALWRWAQDEAAAVVSCYPEAELRFRCGQMGRVCYVQLYLVFDPGARIPNVVAQDELRSLLYERLAARVPHLAMDLVVTTDPVWARRAVTPLSFDQ